MLFLVSWALDALSQVQSRILCGLDNSDDLALSLGPCQGSTPGKSRSRAQPGKCCRDSEERKVRLDRKEAK